MVQDSDKWRDVVNMVRNILVSQISGNVLVLEKILPSPEVLNMLYVISCLVSYLTSVVS